MTNHAIKRAFERYGLTLDDDHLEAIRAKIENGEATLAGRIEDGRERWIVPYAGVLLKTIYHSRDRVILTFELSGRWQPPKNRKGWRRKRKRRNRL